MGNLTNKFINQTYDGLIKLSDETQGVKATLQPLQDGLGNDLPIQVSATEAVITGSFSGDGSNLTGITTTNAVSASHAIFAESALSASYAPGNTDTGSLVSDVILVTPFNNQIEVTKGDGSSAQFTIDNVTSSSYADLASTASYAENVDLPSGLVSGSGQIVELGFATTSSLTSLSSSIAVTDLAQDGRLGSLETESGSIRGDFNSFTSSQAGVDSAQDNRLDSIEEKTGSYATTGSNTFVGQQQINSDLIVQGNLYVSGSEVIVSSSTLIVGDREIELNANRTVGNSGIIVYDVVSPETTGSLQYDVTNNYWIAGQYGSEQRIITSDMTSSMSVQSSVSASYAENVGNDVYVSGATFDSGSGVISLQRTAGEADVTVDIDGRYQTTAAATAQAASDEQRFQFLEYDVDQLEQKTGSYATTGSNVFVGNQVITGSVNVTEGITGSLEGTASYATQALTSSHAIYAETAGSSQYSDNTIVSGKNMTGIEILKGTPLYFSGSGTAGNLVGVYPADAGDPDRMPAGGVAGENIASGAEGVVLIDGFINGVNTSAFAAGDEVYVGVGGGYTNVVPTGSANLIQKLGNVEKSDASNGSGVINGPGAVRSVPNIQEGYIWAGNGDGVATPTSTGSFARRDELNTFTEDQTIYGTLAIYDQDQPFVVSSGSQQVRISLNDFGGGSQPMINFEGDNSYFEATNNFYFNNAPGGGGTGNMFFVTNGNLDFQTNGTGSQAINFTSTTGDVNINAARLVASGDIVADRLVLTGGAGYDLIVTASIKASSTIDAGISVRAGNTTGLYSGLDGYAAFSWNASTVDGVGISADNAGYGNTGWAGPGIWGNDPSDSYPVFIGFQNKASWTDGRITMLKNTDISGSLIVTNGITGSLFGTASYATEALSASYAPMPDISNLATTGSNTFQGNQTINGILFVSQSSGNAVYVEGDVNIDRLHFDRSPFFSGQSSNLGAIRFNNNETLSITNYDKAAFPSGAFIDMTVNTGSNFSNINLYTRYNNVDFEGININNFNGVTDVTISTDNLNVSGTTTIAGTLNVPNANINGKDILVNDPGSVTNIVVNPDYFTEYKGVRIFRNETNSTAGVQMGEGNSVNLTLNGFDGGTGYTYDYETQFLQDSNGLTLKSRNYQSPGYPQFDVFNVKGEEKIVFPNGLRVSGSNIVTNNFITFDGSPNETGSLDNFVSQFMVNRSAYIFNNIVQSELTSGSNFSLSTYGDTDFTEINFQTAWGGKQSSFKINNSNGDGNIVLNTDNVVITGSLSLADTATLAPQDPLPAGGVGELAVSGSNLYYHNGTTWTQIN